MFNNLLGIFLNVPALTLNIKSWLLQENVNLLLTLFISLLAIVWWAMKIYDQYLVTKKRKAENEV